MDGRMDDETATSAGEHDQISRIFSDEFMAIQKCPQRLSTIEIPFLSSFWSKMYFLFDLTFGFKCFSSE